MAWGRRGGERQEERWGPTAALAATVQAGDAGDPERLAPTLVAAPVNLMRAGSAALLAIF